MCYNNIFLFNFWLLTIKTCGQKYSHTYCCLFTLMVSVLHMWYMCLFLSSLCSSPLPCIFHTFFSFYTAICKSFNHRLLFLPLNSFSVYMVFIHPSFPVTLAFQDKLCLPHHILEGKGLTKVGFTVQALVDKASSRRDQRRSPCWRDFTWCCNTSVMFQLLHQHSAC